MRVFVTGASGFIGSAVVPELIGAGHEVVGLARSEASADALVAAGAKVHRGALEDVVSLREGAAQSDGVIHLAFIHDFSDYQAAAAADRAAIQAMGSALEGSGRPLVIASGMLAVAAGRVATECDRPDPNFPRSAAADLTISLADRGVRSSVLRLPPTVHGAGDKGFVSTLVTVARERGLAGYVGDGANRWCAVHRVDAAVAFRLALEQAPAGSILHAVADEGIPTKTIAELIGRHLELPAGTITADEAVEHFGGMIGLVFAADLAASSTFTQELLRWHPTHAGLLEDLAEGHYFHTDV